MNKKIIVTAFLLAAGLFATRNAQAQRTYEEMERLTVNEQVTTVITATEPVRFVDISTDKVAGDQPIENIIRLKPKETGHEDGEVLAIVTIVLMLAVAWLLVKKIVRHPLGVTAGVLILGGGIGNVIDRVCRGYVVDMFDLQFISYPIFNLADCFVVVGVILGAVYYLWFYDKYDKKEPKDDAASES